MSPESRASTDAASTSFPDGSAEALLLSLARPIAIVGNGMPARRFGPRIDGYASVLRLNNYVIDGFETLVGRRTDLRVTSGWSDIEVRAGVSELSPFRGDRPESAGLVGYRQRGARPLALPDTDVGDLLPDVPKPSTGLALVALCSHLGIDVDVFGFDGFRSGHYWDGRQDRSVHGEHEREVLLTLPHVTLMGASYDYARLYDYCHSQHDGYNHNEGLRLFRQLGIEVRGETILEFGAGNGELSAHLAAAGNEVTSMDVSAVALARIPVARKVQGDCLDLALMDPEAGRVHDRFVSMDVLEHLTENDARIVVREAARLCRTMLATVSTRPSGLLGPNGENLHLTVRSVDWWVRLLDRHFVVTTLIPGIEAGQMVIEALSRRHCDVEGQSSLSVAGLPHPPRLVRLGLPEGYRERPVPQYFVDSVSNCANVTWQPDVYPIAGQLARSLGCNTLVDIGCGHARKLVAMAGEFDVIGVDYGPNIEHCRRQHAVGTWLEADLEFAVPLAIPTETLARAVVICSDVIEHMIDPMPLLALLRKLLDHCPTVVLSTPDRARTYGAQHNGPSPNVAHTREWTHEELERLLRHAGFDVALMTHTRSNDQNPDQATILAVLANRQHPAVGAAREAAPVASPRAQTVDAAAAAPRSADEWLALARDCEAAGDVEGFESAMAQAFAIDARHRPSLRYLAGLQLRSGDPKEAAWMYDTLIGEGDVDAETVEGTVIAHWRAGDPKAAAIRLLEHA